jgi:murein L,D-transpeptidase YcbB/YkuD
VSPEDIAAAIGARFANVEDVPRGGPTSAELTEAKRLYAAHAYAALWVDAAGRPSAVGRDARALLDGAAADGLDPEDYDAATLARLAAHLEAAQLPALDDIVAFDVGMSLGVLRFFRHVHRGRVDPRTIGFQLNVPADDHDFVAMVRDALAGGRIAEAATDLAPPLVQYRTLRSMLGRYRALASDASLQAVPPEGPTVRPADRYAGLGLLHRRLVALGDVPPDLLPPAEDASYGEPLVAGVKRFQIRHGLEADGILGKATQAALRVPLAWRVRQIELALERLRWLPDLGHHRFVALNIPMFHLWAWSSVPPTGSPAVGMRAVVGRALSTETPVFVGEMRYIVFRPYWNVPRSIVRNEMLPVLERDPDYLRREHLEIVRGSGDDAPPVEPTAENIALLRKGALRVRQRPGPTNALGLIKFVFPNDASVYLHGTPAQQLFERTRRDFSHGCVRVEDPAALAEWALEEQPEWTRDRILAAMSGGDSVRVDLKRPIQVILFYVTAVVMPEDGTVRFAEDIYGHDPRLDRALARGESSQ